MGAATPAQAQAPTLDSRVLTLERKVQILSRAVVSHDAWISRCLAETVPYRVRTKRGWETVHLLTTTKACVSGHG